MKVFISYVKEKSSIGWYGHLLIAAENKENADKIRLKREDHIRKIWLTKPILLTSLIYTKRNECVIFDQIDFNPDA